LTFYLKLALSIDSFLISQKYTTYSHLSECLLKARYKNDLICPCVFMKKSESDFVILVVYADHINIIGICEEFFKVIVLRFLDIQT
jgi:hypothetical protein